jgi:hypothetical protein
MRKLSDKDIELMVRGVPEFTGGTMPLELLAFSEEDAERLRARIKGRHGFKSTTVRLANEATEGVDVNHRVHE